MTYKISTHPCDHRFLEIELYIDTVQAETIAIQLPAWRPGRYELQNFAKNIQQFEAFGEDNSLLSFKKTKKDRWLIQTNGNKGIRVRYNYFAQKQDAGSSFSDENTLYINPVNCCVYLEDQLHQPCQLELSVPADWQIASGMPLEKRQDDTAIFKLQDFYHLADCPILASPHLRHNSYVVNKTTFHCWFLGDIALDSSRIINDFQRFTQSQIELFGEFPEPDYHFITWVLPTPFYHGVEHRNSTMMVLGPDNQPFEEFYTDLLGLASHELFHAWNVCKIRPKELMPYDFTQENYFETCYVVEGITTYYGDEMLRRSGVFSEEQYLHELEVCLKRHFEHADTACQSLTESSFDLWLDGYTASVPNRKVSVYHKGAIAAMVLDDLIRNHTDNRKNLDDVMRDLWQNFGKPFVGYTHQNFKTIAENVAETNLDPYFSQYIEGRESLFGACYEILQKKNLEMSWNADGLLQLKQKAS